jgi:LacI family transcriptional regulator
MERKRLPKQPTLKDISLRVGVSVPTVSRVLLGGNRVVVSDHTRERIIRVAQELNYRPNAHARGLRNRKTDVLLLFLPWLDHPALSEAVQGVEDAAAENGFSLFINRWNERASESKCYVNWIREGRCDGVIMATALLEDSVVVDLVTMGCPFILLNRRASNTTKYVIVDDFAGSVLAVEHLIELGHRRIAHLSGLLMYDNALRRFQGYRQALANHGLEFRNTLVEESDWSLVEAGRQAMDRILWVKPLPTAVFAGNYVLALAALVSIRNAGLRVPEDISLITLHDVALNEIADPPLSAVKMPLYRMGYLAGRALIAELSGWIVDETDVSVPIVLPPIGLIRRQSTSPPKL